MCEDCQKETESMFKKLVLLSASFVFVAVTVITVGVALWMR